MFGLRGPVLSSHVDQAKLSSDLCAALCSAAHKILLQAYNTVSSYIGMLCFTQASIAAFKKGTLELQAGCNMEQTLEATVTGELNSIREAAGKVGACVCFGGLETLNPKP